MKKIIFILSLLLVSCESKKVESDNEVLKNISSYDFAYVFRGYEEWTVDFSNWESTRFSGKGESLAEAYQDALKHKTMECEIK